MHKAVGVVAIQGDFQKHLQALAKTGVESKLVRMPEDLESIDRLILPGGESTTVGMLMQRFGLGDAIIERAKGGMPLWGTCMGMILLARDIEDREQYRLKLLDITVRRNAFGAQVHSFEDEIRFSPIPTPISGVFIRAPIVSQRGHDVEVLAEYEGKVVAVRQGNVVGTSFHPELTDDMRIHEWFIKL